MTNYRRLISYIYAYEGGIKGKNVGFAKLEVRNGQCKIQVNVRNVFIGSQDTGVYLLSGTEEILVGKIFIRNGAGEFRVIVSVNNVAGSGQTIEQCYGLTVHNLADSWQSYTTIWEDAVAHAAEVALEEATSEQIERREQKENKKTEITGSVAKTVEKEIEAQSRQEKPTQHKQTGAERQKQPPVSPELSSVIPDILSGKEQEDVGTMEIRPVEVKPITGKQTDPQETGFEETGSVGERDPADEEDTKGQQEAEAGDTESLKTDGQAAPEETHVADQEESAVTEGEEEREEKTEAAATAEKGQLGQGRQEQRNLFSPSGWWGRSDSQTRRSSSVRQMVSQPQELRPEVQTRPDSQSRPETTRKPEAQTQPDSQSRPETTRKPEAQTQPESESGPEIQHRPAGISQTEVRTRLESPEEEPRIESIWQQFYKRYPKIQAFDYNGGCDILTIKPQDIGLLPREIWGYGNNSFLLHGYYSHRYIIFARLGGLKGRVRYLLGVPGHYYSNEKYMASMFGFPNFVLSKIQPEGDGRFGYWYTDVHLGS